MKMINPIESALTQAAAVALSLLLLLPEPAIGDDDDAPSRSSTPANLQLAAIKAELARPSQQAPEISTLATVLDIAPLLGMRQQYLSSQAQAEGASAKYRESEQSLRRTQNLHQQDIVASKRLQEQQARWQADKADVTTANLQTQALLASNKLQWGDKLSQWFLQPDDRQIQGLLLGRQRLLSLNLPGEVASGQAPDTIWVDAQGQRQRALRAQLIGIAPQADPLTLRQRAFYQLEASNLPVGSQLTAWLPSSGQGQAGVEIPASAVVWHLGQAFVFLKTATDGYQRRALSSYTPIHAGLLFTTDLQAGAEVVSSGAQTLLSQELKAQIPSEDDD